MNISDLTSLASQWQQTSQGFLSADLNQDGQVNISDLTMLASAWQAALPAGTPAPGAFPAAMPSQAAAADTSSLEQPIAFAVATLPAQPALIQSDASDVFQASTAATILRSSIPAVLRSNTRGSSSPLAVSAVKRELSFVVRRAADVAGSASLSDNAASVARVDSMGTKPKIHGRAKTVFASQASAHDAVLTEAIAAPSPYEMSWVLSPASTLEPLANAVDNVLATCNDETLEV